MSVKPSSHKANISAKATFLANLLVGKSVKAASEHAGVSRRTVYDWRDQDAEFARSWEEAIAGSVEVLEDEVRERALDRQDKNSHILLMFLVKRHRPEYRENYKNELHIVKDSVKEFDFSSKEIEEAVAILQGAANREDKPSP